MTPSYLTSCLGEGIIGSSDKDQLRDIQIAPEEAQTEHTLLEKFCRISLYLTDEAIAKLFMT